MRRVLEFARRNGFRVSLTSRGHLKFSGCGTVIYAPGTPGDFRSPLNTISKLRRALRNAQKEPAHVG